MFHFKHSFAALLAVVCAALLVAAGYLALTNRDGGESIRNALLENAPSLPGSVSTDSDSDRGLAAETQDSGTERFSLLEGTQTLASDQFTMQIPAGWSVVGSKDLKRISDGSLMYGWIYNEPPDDLSDPDVVQITVKDFLKNGASFGSIVAENDWDEADAKEIVAFMSTEAAEAFPDFSESDVKFDTADDAFNGLVAKRNMLQCLKPCYIEGGAETYVNYFVDAPDRVYLLAVSTNTQETAAEFLNAADAVIRTFELQ